MKSNLQPVEKGDPITADAWNDVIRRVNQSDLPQALPARTPKPKGEFWIKNETESTIPVFANVRITGFASNFESVDDFKSALASDAIALNGSLNFVGTPFVAVALEAISPNMCGRATLASGPVVFAPIAGSDSIAVNDRVLVARAGTNAGKFSKSSLGDFLVVAFHSASRFAALCYSPDTSVEYTAGHNVNISGTEISASGSIGWRVANASGGGYGEAKYVSIVSSDNQALLFGRNFETQSRVDDGSGVQIGLRTQTETVVTGVNFAQQTVQTKQITVLK